MTLYRAMKRVNQRRMAEAFEAIEKYQLNCWPPDIPGGLWTVLGDIDDPEVYGGAGNVELLDAVEAWVARYEEVCRARRVSGLQTGEE